MAREDSKVVVTTIADLEFRDDQRDERVALQSSKSGITTSCSAETGKDISEFEGNCGSGFGNGESAARIIQSDFRQQQRSLDGGGGNSVSSSLFPDINPVEQLGHHENHQQPFLMLPPLGSQSTQGQR